MRSEAPWIQIPACHAVTSPTWRIVTGPRGIHTVSGYPNGVGLAMLTVFFEPSQPQQYLAWLPNCEVTSHRDCPVLPMDASILLRDYMFYVTFLYVDTKPGAIPTFSNEMIFCCVLLTKNKKLIWPNRQFVPYSLWQSSFSERKPRR